MDLQVGKKSHAKGSQSRDGGCRGNEVLLDIGHAQKILGIVFTRDKRRAGRLIAHASAAAVGNDASIDGDNVAESTQSATASRTIAPPAKEITHAMAKKVARPARSSVKKYDPFLSFGCRAAAF
jgi:hypothetical protein